MREPKQLESRRNLVDHVLKSGILPLGVNQAQSGGGQDGDIVVQRARVGEAGNLPGYPG